MFGGGAELSVLSHRGRVIRSLQRSSGTQVTNPLVLGNGVFPHMLTSGVDAAV